MGITRSVYKYDIVYNVSHPQVPRTVDYSAQPWYVSTVNV